jgi:hypothetical protein
MPWHVDGSEAEHHLVVGKIDVWSNSRYTWLVTLPSKRKGSFKPRDDRPHRTLTPGRFIHFLINVNMWIYRSPVHAIVADNSLNFELRLVRPDNFPCKLPILANHAFKPLAVLKPSIRVILIHSVQQSSRDTCAIITLQYRARIVTTCHFIPKILTIKEWVHFFGPLCILARNYSTEKGFVVLEYWLTSWIKLVNIVIHDVN